MVEKDDYAMPDDGHPERFRDIGDFRSEYVSCRLSGLRGDVVHVNRDGVFTRFSPRARWRDIRSRYILYDCTIAADMKLDVAFE